MSLDLNYKFVNESKETPTWGVVLGRLLCRAGRRCLLQPQSPRLSPLAPEMSKDPEFEIIFIWKQISKDDNTKIMALKDSHLDAAVQEDNYENNMKNQIEDSRDQTHCLWKLWKILK